MKLALVTLALLGAALSQGEGEDIQLDSFSDTQVLADTLSQQDLVRNEIKLLDELLKSAIEAADIIPQSAPVAEALDEVTSSTDQQARQDEEAANGDFLPQITDFV